MAANLIERLPHEDDFQRPMEEKLAKDVAIISYLGQFMAWMNSKWMARLLFLSIRRC